MGEQLLGMCDGLSFVGRSLGCLVARDINPWATACCELWVCGSRPLLFSCRLGAHAAVHYNGPPLAFWRVDVCVAVWRVLYYAALIRMSWGLV